MISPSGPTISVDPTSINWCFDSVNDAIRYHKSTEVLVIYGFRYAGIVFRLCELLECQVFHKMVHDMIEESKDIFCQVIDALFGLSKVTLNCALLIPPLLAS